MEHPINSERLVALSKAEKLAILESIDYICPECHNRKPFYDAFEFHHENGKQKPLCRSCHKKKLRGKNKRNRSVKSLSREMSRKIPEWNYLNVSARIIRLKQEFPLISCKGIAELAETSVGNVWKTLSIARKKGLV